MRTAGQRILSLVLAAMLALGALPPAVFAAGESTGTGGKIIAFGTLSDSVANQEVPLGTSLEDLDLPDTLTATVQDSDEPAQEAETDADADTPDGDTTDGDAVSGNEGSDPAGDGENEEAPDEEEPNTGSTQTISVLVQEWVSEPEYDPDTPDTYVFTPVLDEAYSLAEDVELPVITVEVIAAAAPMAMNAAIQGGTPNFVWNGSAVSVVGFGGKEWYVIGYDGEGVYSTTNEDAVTLLLKTGQSPQSVSDGYSTTLFDSTSPYSNHYSGSDLQSAMDNAYDNLPLGEKALVNARNFDGSASYNDNTGKVAGEAVNNARFWPLSVSEANSLDVAVLAYSDYWWLRSPGDDDFIAAVVYNNGDVDANGYFVHIKFAVRPAFQLNLSSVLFASAAAGGKSSLDDGLVEAEVPTGAVKFTMVDTKTNNLNLTVDNRDPITAAPGGTVNIPYTGAVTGTNKYVSAVLTDSDTDEVLYYGKLVDLESGGTSGTAAFTVPGLAEGDYKIKIFNEECNGDNQTDFASTPWEIQLEVTSGGNDNFVVGTWTGENGHRWVELGDILWRVLEVTESDTDNPGKKTALLLAEEAVATRQFHTTWNSGDNDWNSSDLKAWLNNELCVKNGNDYTGNGFMSRFSADEKAAIVTANYTYGGSYTGSDTLARSKVFLLSTDNANNSAYFADDADRKSGDWWWLRSLGGSGLEAAFVLNNGTVGASGYYVYNNYAVRPALKINLESSIFTSKNPLVQAKITVQSESSPVAGARISVSGASAPDAVFSEADGTATVRLELGESYTITVSKSGYESYTNTIEITQANQAITVILTPSDTTPPTVESITPANNATDVERSGNIVITFDEPMKTTAGTVSLNGAEALTGGTWSNDNKVYTIGYSGLAYSTQYTVNISGFKDVAGNTMTANHSNRFTTVDAPLPATYAVTVSGSYAATTGASNYAKNDTVTIHAGTRSGYRFTGWTASGVTLASPGSPSTTFTMPANPVTVTANWTHTGSSSGSDDSDSRDSSGILLPGKQPDCPTIGSISGKAAGTTAQRTFTITNKMVLDGIAEAEKKWTGREQYGIALKFELKAEQVKSLTAIIEGDALDTLVSQKIKSFTIQCGILRFALDEKAIQFLNNQSSGHVTVAATPYPVSGAAQAAIGSRPVYNITVTDSSGKVMSSFGSGTISMGIAYKTGNIGTGRLFAVQVKPNGSVDWLQDASYNNGWLIFSPSSLSVYGVGYKPSAAFTDTASHWARENINFAVSRGLIGGISATAFSPDAAITRGAFVTALGRLAGVEVSGYTTSSFSDVKPGSYYLPYVEWAVKNGIVQGVGNAQFAPDKAITREEIAVILQNYAKATGYPLPVARQYAAFADDGKITGSAKDAVIAVQQAGLINGKDGNNFAPHENATRAEAATILRRLVELGIDQNTARGWVKNDSGQWQHYNWKGQRTTGWLSILGTNILYYFDDKGVMAAGKWLQIQDKWHYFYADGSLARNTKIDDYEIDENGVRKDKQQ